MPGQRRRRRRGREQRAAVDTAQSRRTCSGKNRHLFHPFQAVGETSRLGVVEAVAIAVLTFGPLLAFLVLLFKATRKLMPQQPIEAPAWKPPGTEQPPRGGDPAGGREPRRPLIPSGSAAVNLTLPSGDAWEEDQAPVRPTDPRHGGSDPRHRLAG